MYIFTYISSPLFSGRGAIADYMSVVVGGDNQSKKVLLPGALHPAIERAVEITAGYFDELMIRNQDFLSTPEKRNQVRSSSRLLKFRFWSSI